MKNLILFSFFSLLLLASCSKSEDPTPGEDFYIKFKVNGTQIEYKGSASTPITIAHTPPTYLFTATLIGPGSDGTKDFITVSGVHETEFAAGVTYNLQDGTQVGAVKIAKLNLTYSDINGNIYNAVILQSNVPSLVIKDQATWRFNNLDGQVTTGVFNGLIIGPVSTTTGRGTDELTISDGEFRLPFMKTY